MFGIRYGVSAAPSTVLLSTPPLSGTAQRRDKIGEGAGEELAGDRGRHDLLPPGDEPPRVIERRFEPVQHAGTEVIVADVVLAAPEELDRHPHPPRDLGGLLDEVGLGAAPEPSPEPGGVDLHVVRPAAEGAPGDTAGPPAPGKTGPILELRRRPDLAGDRIDGAVHRLHRPVGQEGELELRLDHRGAGGEDAGGVAIVSGHPSFVLVRDRAHPLPDRRVGECGKGSVVPFEDERPASLQRLPVRLRHHRHLVTPPHHVADPGEGARRRVVEGTEGASPDGGALDGGVEHPGHPDVGAEGRLPR